MLYDPFGNNAIQDGRVWVSEMGSASSTNLGTVDFTAPIARSIGLTFDAMLRVTVRVIMGFDPTTVIDGDAIVGSASAPLIVKTGFTQPGLTTYNAGNLKGGEARLSMDNHNSGSVPSGGDGEAVSLRFNTPTVVSDSRIVTFEREFDYFLPAGKNFGFTVSDTLFQLVTPKSSNVQTRTLVSKVG